jgi:hypothetical protein
VNSVLPPLLLDSVVDLGSYLEKVVLGFWDGWGFDVPLSVEEEISSCFDCDEMLL